MNFERCNHFTYRHVKLAEAVMPVRCSAGLLSPFVQTYKMTKIYIFQIFMAQEGLLFLDDL